MITTFERLWGLVFNFINSLVQGLDNVIIASDLDSLKTYVLNIKLLSDNPILTVDLFTILVWLGLAFGFFMFYKVFKAIIKMPARLFK